MFVSKSARLLRQFPGLNAIKMTLPFEGKTYNINLNSKPLNTHLGFKFDGLKVEGKSSFNKFNNPYIYDKTQLKPFSKKFVAIKEYLLKILFFMNHGIILLLKY